MYTTLEMINMKILVAVDSFKGTMSSSDISSIIKNTYESQGHDVTMVPISDGGEGFVTAVATFFGVPLTHVATVGPLGDPIDAPYVLHQDKAFIELSSAAGLVTIGKERLNPLRTSTYGLGPIVKDAISKGARTIVFGIGGSATNDGGAGFLQSLGVRFYAEDKLVGHPIDGSMIGSVTSFDTTGLDALKRDVSFELASDVNNPLLGESGCARIYSGQKGAGKETRDLLETNMEKFADTVESAFGKTCRDIPGAGAAGGFGFGLMTFLNARLTSGIAYIIDLLGLDSVIRDTDLVIVGEGRLDRQTLHGKAPYGLAKLAKRYNKKVIGIFAVSDHLPENDFMDEIHVIVPSHATLETSMRTPREALKTMLEKIKV
jgi:glycerate 2-kinase